MAVNYAFDTINPAFYAFWISDKPNKILKGGRSSTKSSVTVEYLVEQKEADPESNYICIRKYATTLRTSVYTQVTWALRKAGVADNYIFQKMPLQIIHKEYRTGFYFVGVDDPEKLKSFKIPVGYVKGLWMEEMSEFAGVDEVDTIQDTFIRESVPNGHVELIGTYNPPRNPYHWINEFVQTRKDDPSYFIHHSTYLDDTRGYNSKQILDKIEQYATNDYDYYRWMYLGEVIGLGENVYNMDLFHAVGVVPDDDRITGLYYAADTGHQVSATTCLCFATTAKSKVVLLDTYYYSPSGKVQKKAPSELSEELYNFIQRTATMYPDVHIIKRTIDSAEGALRNQYYKDYGQRWNPVAKKKKTDMIDCVHDLLAQGRFFYVNNENNKIFIDEQKMYQWDKRTKDTANPEVIKENDHTCDAFQYFCVDNSRELNLRW